MSLVHNMHFRLYTGAALISLSPVWVRLVDVTAMKKLLELIEGKDEKTAYDYLVTSSAGGGILRYGPTDP